MSLTFTQAKDQTYSIFYEELKAASPSIVGYIPEIRWEGVEYPHLPDISKFYIRTMFEEIENEQSAFGMSEPGKRRLYASQGIATFAIHSPRSTVGSKRKAQLIAECLKTAFRRYIPGCGVWFRRQRIQETYPEDQFLRTNFTTGFYFTEVD